MAEGGPSEPVLHVEGSDQEFLHVCDCCRFEGTESEAVAFCVFCTDYMCDSCLRAHKKSRATRQHEILEGDAIKEARGGGTAILAVELCDYHKDSKVTFYCSTHDCVLCDTCNSIHHRKCSDVKTIEEVSTCEPNVTKEAEDFLKKTKSLISDFNVLHTQRREAMTEIAEKKISCLQEIKKQKTVIINLLDRIEKHMEEKVTQSVDKESEAIAKHLAILDNAIKTLEAQSGDLEKATIRGKDKAFIAMKRIHLPKLTELLQDIDKEQYQEDIELEVADLVQALQGNVHHLCQIKVHSVGFPIDDGKLIRDNVKDKDLNKMSQCNVALPSEETCNITGCQVLPNGDFLLCDYGNSSLKILNLATGLTSHVQLIGQPYDVSLVTHEEAVVTLPLSQAIQFVSLKPKLTSGKRLDVGQECWGVAYSRNKLYLACGKGYQGEILTLDLQGQSLGRVSFTCPARSPLYLILKYAYLAIARDNTGRIYATARRSANAVCFNKDDYKPEYDSHTGVATPSYILTDKDQHAFICGEKSKLQIMSPDGQLYRTLLKEQPKAATLGCMAYRGSDKTLLVGMESDSVAVYRFV